MHALGNSKCPNSLEDVIHVLITHALKHGKMVEKSKTKGDDNAIGLSFQQASSRGVRKCTSALDYTGL